MNAKIKKHLQDYCNEKGYEWSDEPMAILETLDCGKELYRHVGDSHRWYDELTIVVELDGMIIGFEWVHTTGDNSPTDMDIKFDLNSIREMEAKEVKSVIYVDKEEK